MEHLGTLLSGYLAPVLAGGVYGFLRLFWYYAFFEFPRYVATDLLVLGHRWFKLRRPCVEYRAPYTILAAVYNEEDTVALTVRSLEEQTHPPQKIILVNDGSTDGTGRSCRRLAAGSDRIVCIDQPERNGKSAALNRGLAQVKTDLVVFVDADTTFDRDALEKLVRPFVEPDVLAVGGTLRVRNRHHNLLTEIQALEYNLSIFLSRQAKSLLGFLPIISGAFGAFRTRAALAVGGHDPGPGNDSDLTLDVRRLGGRLVFAPDAVCHTNVPTTLSRFIRQRRRWARNGVKNRLRKHRNILSPFSRNFRFRDVFTVMDPILYHVIFVWAWFVYVLSTVATVPQLLAPILIGNWCLYMLSAGVQQTVVALTTERPREEFQAFLFLPLFHLFRVFYRFVLMFAQVEEIFTRASLRDPFAPEKVRRAMPDW